MQDETIARAVVQSSPESIETSEPRSESQPDFTSVQTDIPISQFNEIKKYPFLLEHLKAVDVISHFSVKNDSEYVEQFILQELQRTNLKENKDNYLKVLGEYTKKLNIPEDIDVYSRLERLASYMKIQQRLYDDIQEREDLLKKDPKDMTAKELRKYLEIK